jgi:amino acid adenylation domain-containing protein
MEVDPVLYQKLKKATPSLGGTLFSTLLATFATLLHRLTGQEDVVIGVPAAGQTLAGRDELIGHCLNFLPFRLRPEGSRPFREFASEVKGEVLEAFEHQNYTFGSLLKQLDLPRDTSRLPLVNVMFNIDKSGFDHVRFDGLTFDITTNPKRFVNFELFFNLQQSDERLAVQCEYNTDLHDAATIRRWLGAFEALIAGLVEEGDRLLNALPVLSPADRELLEQWNATSRPFPSSTIDQLIPHDTTKPAVVCGTTSLTYAELEQRAISLAARLQSAGVKRGDLVGIHLERSTDMVAGVLAILKCGAAYVPMDPAFPAERLGFMIEDAHMRVILSQSSHSATLSPSEATLLLIDEAVESSSTFQPVERDAEDLAYVIFTSGSTGRPKGVRISHRAVVNFLQSMRREPGLTAEDRLLAVTTLSFDIAGLELFLPLTTGATVVIATRDTVIDGDLLKKEIDHHGITFLQATPATWRLLLEAQWNGKSDLKILIGGEAVPRELVNRLAPKVKEIWNVYGPTETTIWSTTARVEAGEGHVSIGRPIDNTTVVIVNQALVPQPLGIAGELLIGGDGLAQGYHERDDLTIDRFIELPCAPGQRFYRTGDLARWHEDGTLECLGRMDHQVKVRGFRIELGDIETHLEQHPAITQAIAHVQDGRLLAYVRPATSESGTAIWEDQWDMLYKSAIEQSGSDRLDQLDAVITSWAGLDNADAQVGEWIDTTVDRILSYDPHRIFEIGCGTGQILSRLAPRATTYWAADISKVAIEALEQHSPPPSVKLFHRPADDFSGISHGSFDTVIINSVAQYFPDAAYLKRVLQGALLSLAPGGRIFLGDMQSNALLAAHHAETLRERAPVGTTCGQLRDKLAQRLAQETELSIDPAWFEQLDISGIGEVEIQLRRGTIANETTTYHYDVILHSHPAPPKVAIENPRPWERMNLEQLEAMLAETPRQLAFTDIPDARLGAPIWFLDQLQSASPEDPAPFLPAHVHGVTAEELFATASRMGYRAHVRWQNDGSDGLMRAAFLPDISDAFPSWKPHGPTRSPEALANVPNHAKSSTAQGDLAADLRRHLAAKLPDYMVPTAFVVVDAFPLTPNGKVDRKALPSPDIAAAAPSARTIIAPRNEPERQLTAIWQQVLGLPEVSVEDDIFELGGDSILIFQITTRANRAGMPITPAQVFRLRTISAIAAASEAAPTEVAAASSTIRRVNRDAYRRKL